MNIKARNIIVDIVLSLVTCNLYCLYWEYCSFKEIYALEDANHNDLIELILMILFPYVGFYMMEKKFAKVCQANGIEHKDNSILYLVLCLVSPIISMALLQNEMNKLASAAE